MKTERALVMGLSYVIGFTAAFIAYGIVDTELSIETEPAAVAQTSLTVLPQNNSVAASTQAVAPRATGVVYDEHLYAEVDGEQILISADDAYGEGSGFHHAVTSFALENNGKKIRFCVLETPTAASCTSKIYTVAEHTVSPGM